MDTNDDEKRVLRPVCPYCRKSERQVKAGISQGSQRYKCGFCLRRYLLQSRRDHPDSLRQQALQLQGQGRKLREIGRELGVSPQTVANWLRRSETGDPVSANGNGPHPAELASGDKKRPTIKDVARAAGVSTSTISNYLNDRRRMSGETRQRIEAAIDRLNFTPSALVRAIRHRRTRILGVLLWSLNDLDRDVGGSLAPPLLAGINSAADRAEHNILLYTGWPDRPHRHPGLEFLDGHIDGLLWVGPDINEPTLERVAQAGLPVVTVLSRHVPPGVGYVRTDNFAAMQVILEHLTSQGHQRIAFVGPTQSSSDFRDRRDGYRAALAACGHVWDSALEIEITRNVWDSIAYEPALDRLLTLSAPPTAIIMPNDGLAALMIRLLRARGLRVPEDIAVIGFDDIPDAQHLEGGLTTIHQPLRRIGETAVKHLLALMAGAPLEECQSSLPGHLVVRASG